MAGRDRSASGTASGGPVGTSWPRFGRDAADVAWRPTPRDLAESRLAGFLRAVREPTLDDLQARAEHDPAWFWGAAADDLAIPWQHRPREVLDVSGGV